jgi:hypothetical protein
MIYIFFILITPIMLIYFCLVSYEFQQVHCVLPVPRATWKLHVCSFYPTFIIPPYNPSLISKPEDLSRSKIGKLYNGRTGLGVTNNPPGIILKYCDMITWSVARQRLGKHVAATTDTQATIEDVVEHGVYYAVRAGREPQEAWRQGELIGGEVTLIVILS